MSLSWRAASAAWSAASALALACAVLQGAQRTSHQGGTSLITCWQANWLQQKRYANCDLALHLHQQVLRALLLLLFNEGNMHETTNKMPQSFFQETRWISKFGTLWWKAHWLKSPVAFGGHSSSKPRRVELEHRHQHGVCIFNPYGGIWLLRGCPMLCW